jgi:hypothetical protein
LAFCAARGVRVANYGDDTAFGGDDEKAVDECVNYARAKFAKYGFDTNLKSTGAEHQGAPRRFIGTATGRETPDLPRPKFREYRKQFRAALNAEHRDMLDAFLARDGERLTAVSAAHHRHLEESIAALPPGSAVFAWSDPRPPARPR